MDYGRQEQRGLGEAGGGGKASLQGLEGHAKCLDFTFRLMGKDCKIFITE